MRPKEESQVEQRKIYEDIALRTEGDIYIGVVGPVRTGKSTFIKRFMETMVIPNIENVYRRERARDELPQSGSGRTIMTAEPKFVPEEAVQVTMDNGAAFSVRLIDCVGYMVPGATGSLEDDAPRMVTTPWFDYEIPMTEAAEIGTRKVIAEHSTIGIVVTTDGSITDIPREDYLEAEERVILELKELGKPFLVVLNSAYPSSERAQAIRADIASRYDVTCVCVDCLQLDESAVTDIIKGVLYEFPVKELDLFLPPWVDALPYDHPIKSGLYSAIRQSAEGMHRIRDVEKAVTSIGECDTVSRAAITSISLGTGQAVAQLELPRSLFYDTLSQQSGFTIHDDGDLLELLSQLSHVKTEYDKVAGALEEVKATGYGIVVPSTDELVLEEPEIVKQGGRYGVRLKASAPSIHIVWNKTKMRTKRGGHTVVCPPLLLIGISHKICIHFMSCAASFLNGPDHQRLAAAHIPGGEDARHVGLITAVPGFYAGTGRQLQPKGLRHIGLWPQKSCCNQEQLTLQRLLGTGNRLKFLVKLYGFDCLQSTVFIGKKFRHRGLVYPWIPSKYGGGLLLSIVNLAYPGPLRPGIVFRTTFRSFWHHLQLYHTGAPMTDAGTYAVVTGITSTDNNHLFTLGGGVGSSCQPMVQQATCCLFQKVHSKPDAIHIATRNGQVPWLSGAAAQHDCVIIPQQLFRRDIPAYICTGTKDDPLSGHPFQPAEYHGLFQFHVRDAVHQQSARPVFPFKNGDRVSTMIELFGTGQTRWAGANHGHSFSGAVLWRMGGH